MKAVVTGSKGFIGSNMESFLKSAGHEVLGLDAGNCDLNDFGTTLKLIKGFKPDVIFHLAAMLHQAEDSKEAAMVGNNVLSTFNILKAAAVSGVQKLIFSSTMNVYGKPQYLPVDEKHPLDAVNAYGLSKIVCEDLCRYFQRTAGLESVILRYSGVFGKGRKGGAISGFIENAMAGKPLKVTSGDSWDTLMVDDIVKAGMLAADRKQGSGLEIFNIGYGQLIPVLDAAQKVLRLTHSSSKIEEVKSAEKIEFYYDISKAKRILGFSPEPFDASLERYVSYKMKGGK